MIPDPDDALILHTPGIKNRLNDLATLSPNTEPYIIKVAPLFNKIGQTERVISWAKSTLQQIERIIPVRPNLKPESILENPLYIWGAAVMDNLLIEEAMPAAINFIEEKFGNLVEHPECMNWLFQVSWIANLYIKFLSDSNVEDGNYELELHQIKKFAKFCFLAGYMFPIFDK